MFFHCLLACKSAVILIYVTLYVNISFPPSLAFLFLSFLSSFLPFFLKNFSYGIFWCSFHHVSYAWSSLSSLDLRIYNVHQIRKIFVMTYSNIFPVPSFLSSSETPIVCVLGNLKLNSRSLIFHSLILFFLFLCFILESTSLSSVMSSFSFFLVNSPVCPI